MFVGRRISGEIYGMWTVKQQDDEFHPGMEELPDDHPDVVAFVNRPMPQAVDKIVALEARIVELESRARL